MAATGVRVGRWRSRPASYGKIELPLAQPSQRIVPQSFYLVRDASSDCHWLPANKASFRGEGQSHLFDSSYMVNSFEWLKIKKFKPISWNFMHFLATNSVAPVRYRFFLCSSLLCVSLTPSGGTATENGQIVFLGDKKRDKWVSNFEKSTFLILKKCI